MPTTPTSAPGAPTTEEKICREIKEMTPAPEAGSTAVTVPVGWTPSWTLVMKLLELFKVLFPTKQPMEATPPVGHAINHIDDPLSAVMVAIDSSKEKAERGCAICDVLWFASNAFLPHSA